MRRAGWAALLALATGCVHTVSRPHRPVEELPPPATCVEVQAGETLYRIALRLKTTPDLLAKANGVEDPRTLKVGQRLCAPPESSVRSSEAAAQVEPHPPFSWPLRGVLYARFGKRGGEQHDGIDLAAPRKTPVQTTGAGQVLFAGEQAGYGLLVIVEHDARWVSLYAHNNDLRVREGQSVRPGQVLSTVGESGRTSGPHLHFELRRNGMPVDPLPLLGPPERAHVAE